MLTSLLLLRHVRACTTLDTQAKYDLPQLSDILRIPGHSPQMEEEQPEKRELEKWLKQAHCKQAHCRVGNKEMIGHSKKGLIGK